VFSNVFQDYWKLIYKLIRTFTLIKKINKINNASHKLEEIGWMVDEIFFSFEFKS
jgi:hypothetical protein